MFPLRDNIPTARFPIITVALIAANVLVYFLWQKGGLSFGDPGGHHYVCNVNEYGAVPKEFTHPGFSHGACPGDSEPSRWITPFTAMFMHGGLLHLGGNMLFLWIFGNNVEDGMGRIRFLVFYVVGGLVALAAQVLVGPGADVPTIGASGAIGAVLGGYILLYPKARVLSLITIVFFFTLVEIPAPIVLGIWFAQQVLFGALDFTNPTGGGGGVAYFAHIGGFAFGLLTVRAFAAGRTRPRRQDNVWDFR